MTHSRAATIDFAAIRFDSPRATLGRWDTGSNPRFLRRRSKDGWRRRNLSRLVEMGREMLPSGGSMWKQGMEAGLFATYFCVFLASLYALG